ncbi:MAG: peptide-binding protein [Bacteroidia bacterium]
MKPQAILLLILSLVALQSCRTENGADAKYKEEDAVTYYRGPKTNEVVAHLVADPRNMHPFVGQRTSRYEVLDLCYERLMATDMKTGKLVPVLLAGEPTASPDRLTYTYTLHPDAAWPDGAPITARDVLFSTKLIVCPGVENGNIRNYAEYIKDFAIDPDDPKRFTLEMSQYYMNNENFGIFTYVLDQRVYDPQRLLDRYGWEALARDTGPAAADTALQRWAADFNDTRFGTELSLLQNGSGPYRIESWIPDQEIVLVRNETYWAKDKPGYLYRQHPDRIRFVIIPEGKTVELQIRQQEIDVATSLMPQHFIALRDDSLVGYHYHLEQVNRDAFTSLALNTRPDGIRHPRIFNELAVRRALAFAISPQQLIDDFLDSMAVRAVSPVSPVNPLFNEKLQPIPFDPAQARALLEAAGWQDSDNDGVREKIVGGKKELLSFTLIHMKSDPLLSDMAQRISRQLEAVGMACRIEVAENFAERLQTHDFDAAFLALRATPLPYDFKQLFYSTNWPDGTNYFGFSDPTADRLIDAMRTDTNLVLRKARADSIQQILYDQMPLVPLYIPTRKIAVHRRFNNWQPSPVPNYVALNYLHMMPF